MNYFLRRKILLKPKIVYLNVMDYYSGGEIVLQRLIRQVDKNKFDILVFSKNTKFVETLNCPKCKVITFDTQYNMRFARGLKMIGIALKNFFTSAGYILLLKFKYKVDIIHSNTILSNIYFAFWAKLFRLKFIAHSHEIREGKIYKYLHLYIAFCSDYIITVSDAVKNDWIKDGVNPDKIQTIYNGLPHDFF